MTVWYVFAGIGIGMILQQALMVSTMAVPAAWRHFTGRPRKRPHEWEIGGRRFVSRPITRAVMENLTAVNAELSSDPVANVPPFIQQLTGLADDDEDERRRRHVEIQAERIQASYASVQIVLVDRETGEPPTIEFLNEHLLVEQASEILGAVL